MVLQNFSFIKPELAGSDAPYTTSDLMKYIDAGITHIFALTPELTLAEKMISDFNLPLEIIHVPTYGTPTLHSLKKFVEFVIGLKQQNKKAVVHCQFGQERTGIFLAFYLYKAYGLKIDDAIKMVQKSRPTSLKSSNSIEFLKSTCG